MVYKLYPNEKNVSKKSIPLDGTKWLNFLMFDNVIVVMEEDAYFCSLNTYFSMQS